MLKAKNFGEVIRSWSRDKFLSTFAGAYPDNELIAVADEMGLKSENISKPKRGKDIALEDPGPDQRKESDPE